MLPLLALTGCDRVSLDRDAIDRVVDRVDRALNRETEAERTVREEAERANEPPEEIPPPPEPVKMEPAINKEARVAVLGYHDFTEGRSSNDMIMNIDDFREQMEAVKDSGLPVISMREFLDWKAEKADIPPRCVMITIDDGWKATHTLALDVLRSCGFPFTVFLYKDYVGTGGRSLTHEEIRELAAAGATIGSHSVSHKNMSRRAGRSEEEYDAWLREELEESYRFLEENFADTGALEKVFAYPFGIYNDRVLELAEEAGYEAGFTVDRRKTNWEDDPLELGRYVVHGTTLANFDMALDFGGGPVTASGLKLIAESENAPGQEDDRPRVILSPEKDAVIAERLPLIRVDLSALDGVEGESISMRVSGFGQVRHHWDPASGTVSYRVPQKLRSQLCSVQVSFRHAGNPDPEQIGWSFGIDHFASYIEGTVAEEEVEAEEQKQKAESAPGGAEAEAVISSN